MIGKRRWTIRMLLIGVNLFILLVPLGALVFTKVFEAYLLRQTERQLIVESVVIGEILRERLLAELGLPEEPAPAFRPPDLRASRFTPHRPLLDLRFEALPEVTEPSRRAAPGDSAASRAGASIQTLLQRTQVFNLSGARVLDEQGCVVATSGADPHTCLDHLEEVRAALAGRYSAVVRRRHTDSPKPPLTSLERRGALRVFTAIPIFVDDHVAGVVRMSRTSVAPLELLWAHRGKVLLVAGIGLLFTPVLSYLFSHAISKPVRDLTRAAESIARGEQLQEFTPGSTAPREVVILSDALNRMTSQLTEKSEYILQFANNVSHEVKTPVTGITGAIELLQDGWEEMPADQRRRFLDNIAADAARMERLATDLLRLARIDSVRAPQEEIALGSFLEGFAERYGKALRVEPTDPGRTLLINRDHLETALHNLVDNGVRHGEGQPVELRSVVEAGRPVFYIRDHGPGISEANRPRIFDRFFTTERERGGTGLGLPIVRAIAESRGGQIDFRSDGTGTEFRLVL